MINIHEAMTLHGVEVLDDGASRGCRDKGPELRCFRAVRRAISSSDDDLSCLVLGTAIECNLYSYCPEIVVFWYRGHDVVVGIEILGVGSG